MVQHLQIMYKALGLIPSSAKNHTNKQTEKQKPLLNVANSSLVYFLGLKQNVRKLIPVFSFFA
jgi:hypothetical protein